MTISSSTEKPAAQGGPLSRLQIALLAALGGVILLTPGSLKYKIEYLGFGICHQISSHSFYIGGHQCPLCARCMGIYLGAGITFIMQKFLRPYASRLPSRTMLPILGVMFASMVLDGINSTLQSAPGATTLYETTNVLRIVTGALSGMSLMFVLHPLFNQTFWRPELLSDERSLESPFELLGYFIPVGAVVAIILSANGDPSVGEWLYWPVTLLTMFGLLAMLVMASVMIVSAFSRRAGSVATWRQALTPLLIAVFISLGFMALLSYGRVEITALAGAPPIAGLPLQPGLP